MMGVIGAARKQTATLGADRAWARVSLPPHECTHAGQACVPPPPHTHSRPVADVSDRIKRATRGVSDEGRHAQVIEEPKVTENDVNLEQLAMCVARGRWETPQEAGELHDTRHSRGAASSLHQRTVERRMRSAVADNRPSRHPLARSHL